MARGVVEVLASGVFWLWLWLFVWPLVRVKGLLGWTTQYCTLQSRVRVRDLIATCFPFLTETHQNLYN